MAFEITLKARRITYWQIFYCFEIILYIYNDC